MVRTTECSALKVVIAASDFSFRRLMRETLETGFGHQVVGEAASGTEMVRTVLANGPDAVVFDLHLPHLNGVDALQQIREQQDLAAVAITENRDQERLYQLVTDNVQVCLLKPFEPQQLHWAVISAWARFEEVRQLRAECNSLRQSLQNRKIIERTKGVLMKRHHWSEAEAYRRLQRGAMNGRTTMVQLAQAVLNGAPVEL
jgi:response regulator NasT